MSEQRSQTRDRESSREAQAEERKGSLKLLGGTICSALGILLAAGGIIGSFLGSVDVTPGALGALLGVVGYFLGSRRLAVAAVVLGVAAVFFAAAASTGLIPGIQPPGHSYNG